MSYILEALRKSERQRREIEDQPLVRLASSAPSQKSRWRLVILLLVVGTNVAVLAYLAGRVTAPERGIAHRGAEQTAPKEESRPREGIAPPVATENASSKAEASSVHAKEPVQHPAPPGTSFSRTAKGRPPGGASGAPTANAAARASAREAPPQNTAMPEAADPAPVSFSALRANRTVELAAPREPIRAPAVPHAEPVTDGFPKPKINVYAYTARVDGDRFVIIQNQKYREGDQIEGGAIVRRIEEHAMTLEYQGQTYKVPRP